MLILVLSGKNLLKKINKLDSILIELQLELGVLIKYLEDNDIVVQHFKYPDHYNYKEKDVLEFQDNITITTEKDYTKLRKFDIKNLFYLPISVEIDDEKNLIKEVENKIG